MQTVATISKPMPTVKAGVRPFTAASAPRKVELFFQLLLAKDRNSLDYLLVLCRARCTGIRALHFASGIEWGYALAIESLG